MTFSITLFVISWICFFIFADRKNFHLFYSTCLLSAYLSSAVDFFATEHYVLWDYPQGTRLQTYLYHLMQQFGVYPVVVYLFLQTLPKKEDKFHLIRHVFYWTIFSIVVEWLATQIGFMKYEKWWNSGWSYFSDWILFFVFYLHYKWRSNKFFSIRFIKR